MTDPFLAYISSGQLHLQSDGGSEIVESPFGRSLRDRAAEIYNRHLWKSQGRGGQALSRALRAPAERNPTEFRIAITSVTRGHNAGELYYSLETDEISGVFARDAAGVEKRLFHTADFRTSHLDRHSGTSEIALSVNHHALLSNIAVLKADGSDLIEVTDGDSLDTSPRWVSGTGRRVVYQSAGIGRDRAGRLSGHGPFTIQQLDLDTGEVTCLAENADFDFLSPRIAADGSLWYIRKPIIKPAPANPATALQHTVLLPFRILWGIMKLVELIARSSSGGQISAKEPGAEKATRTPSSWLLMRQTPGTQEGETIARHVMSFDLAADGSVIYSDGCDVYRTGANGQSSAKILEGANVEIVAAL